MAFKVRWKDQFIVVFNNFSSIVKIKVEKLILFFLDGLFQRLKTSEYFKSSCSVPFKFYLDLIKCKIHSRKFVLKSLLSGNGVFSVDLFRKLMGIFIQYLPRHFLHSWKFRCVLLNKIREKIQKFVEIEIYFFYFDTLTEFSWDMTEIANNRCLVQL